MSSVAWSGWEEVYPRPRCLGPNAAGVSTAVAAMVSSYGVPSPTDSPSFWRWEVLGCVSIRGVGSSAKLLYGGIRLGGVTGPCGDIGRASPVGWGEVSEGVVSGDPQTGP
jgi:hypothetical protein